MQTERDKLLALAERVEQATGPDTMLDVDIDLALFPDAKHIAGTIRYTASVDAALTLVPEGWVCGFESWPHPEYPSVRAWLNGTSEVRIGKQTIWGHSTEDPSVEARAATPALAICAAALRTKGGSDGR